MRAGDYSKAHGALEDAPASPKTSEPLSTAVEKPASQDHKTALAVLMMTIPPPFRQAER
jgi:hypothetical protein